MDPGKLGEWNDKRRSQVVEMEAVKARGTGDSGPGGRKGWVGEDAEGRLYGWKGEGQWQRQAVERKWGGLGASGTEAVPVKADQQGRISETRRDASEQGNRG